MDRDGGLELDEAGPLWGGDPQKGTIVMRCPRCQTYMWKVTATEKWKCLSCLWPDEEKK